MVSVCFFPFLLEQPCREPARGGGRVLPLQGEKQRPPQPPGEAGRGGGGRPEKRAGAGRTQSLRCLCFPPSKGDCGLPRPELQVRLWDPALPDPSCLGIGAASAGVGSLSQPHLPALPAPHPHPAGSCCQPIPAGSLPAQVTRGVLGETGEGPARAQMLPGVCCRPLGSGARLPRA